jgi:hypothetical protein
LFLKTGNAIRATLNASGNLGLGVTPSAWSLVVPAFQVNSASFSSYDNSANIGSNFFYNGSSDRYINNGFASLYQQYQSKHMWLTAPSGTAGNAISFTQAMTLNASGNLSIGNTNNTYKLDVSGTGRFTSDLLVVRNATMSSYVANVTGTAGAGVGSQFLLQDGGTNVAWFRRNRDGAGVTELANVDGTFIIKTGATAAINALTIASTGAATFSSSIKTGNPGLGSAGAIKLGQRFTGTAIIPSGYIPIDIDGTTYYINLFEETP